jgi:hypothetical protein
MYEIGKMTRKEEREEDSMVVRAVERYLSCHEEEDHDHEWMERIRQLDPIKDYPPMTNFETKYIQVGEPIYQLYLPWKRD